MNGTVELIFKILNFALLVGIVVYLVRRHGILFIVSSMRSEKEERLALETQHKKLLDEYEEVKQKIEEQEEMYQRLQKKFDMWEQDIKHKREQQQEHIEQRKQEIEALTVKKIDYLQERKFLQTEFPKIMKESVEELQQVFDADPVQRKKYISKLASYLEK